MNIFSLNRYSSIVLIYGLYAVLCQAVAIFFNVISSAGSSGQALALKYAPMLEHSVMSFVLILIGALLIEITVRDTKK
jgi:hypothetical protein